MLKNNLAYLLLGLILLTHTLILSKLIFFPYPELFIYPYLTNHHLKPYQQILDQHFPGLMFLPINFDNLGMTNEVIARVWLMTTVLIIQLFLFLIAKLIFKSENKALLVSILYLIWQPFFEGWVLWIDNFLPLLLLPAFYCLYKRKFLFTGILLGLGIIFKQTLIPLSILVLIYLIWSEKSIKVLKNYLLGLISPILLMLLYLGAIGVLRDFWYWTIVFNLTVYASTGTQFPKSFGFISRIFLVYVSSLSAYLFTEKRLVIILFIFLFGSLAGAFDRANFVHFQPSLPFALLSTTLGVYSLTKKRLAFILIGLYLIVTLWWQNIFYKGHLSTKVFFFDQSTYALAGKIMQYTKPNEKIFVYGAAPHLYQMSHTSPAGDIFVFQFPWFLKVSEDRILDGIKKDQPKIIVFDTSYAVEGQELKTFSKKIYQYIESHYQKIDNINTTEILQRKD